VGAVDVLQVITSASPRGAERYAVMLEPELAARGLSVRTVALHAGANPGLDVEVLGPSRRAPDTIRALRRACRQSSVVIAHGSATLLASSIATAGTGVPFVYRNIGDPAYWASSRARRWRTRLFLFRAAEVVALTQEARRRMVQCYGIATSRIAVIPNGVPVQEFPRRTEEDRMAARAALSIPPHRRVALYLGALSPEKDVPTAVRAMLDLPDRWMLLVGGDGPQRQEILDLAVSVPGPDRVRLLGHVGRPVDVLTAADVLVLPSLTEGLPGVIIEAAMVGVPSAVTDAGFVRDLVTDGVNGFVVPISDPGAMAAAILRVEQDADRLGASAHEQSTRDFSLATTADQWLRVLQAYVPGSGGTGGGRGRGAGAGACPGRDQSGRP
jgi:glycosyltransferase involved in cell wall biosynthesis